MQAQISRLTRLCIERESIVRKLRKSASPVSHLPTNENLTKAYVDACKDIQGVHFKDLQPGGDGVDERKEFLESLSACIHTFRFVPKDFAETIIKIFGKDSSYIETMAICSPAVCAPYILQHFMRNPPDSDNCAELAFRMFTLALLTAQGGKLNSYVQDLPLPFDRLEIESAAVSSHTEPKHAAKNGPMSRALRSSSEATILNLLAQYSQAYVTKSRVHTKKGFYPAITGTYTNDVYRATIAMSVCAEVPSNWITFAFHQVREYARMFHVHHVLAIGRCYAPKCVNQTLVDQFAETWSALLSQSRFSQEVHLLNSADLLFCLEITIPMWAFYKRAGRASYYGAMCASLFARILQFDLAARESYIVFKFAIGNAHCRPKLSREILVDIQSAYTLHADARAFFTEDIAIEVLTYASTAKENHFSFSPRLLNFCLEKIPAEKCSTPTALKITFVLLQNFRLVRFRKFLGSYLSVADSTDGIISSIFSDDVAQEFSQRYRLYRNVIEAEHHDKLDEVVHLIGH